MRCSVPRRSRATHGTLPAARHHPQALTDRGSTVRHRCGAQGRRPVHDFLGMARPPVCEVASIITNPPYGVAQEFAERALSIATTRWPCWFSQNSPTASDATSCLPTTRPPSSISSATDHPCPQGRMCRRRSRGEGRKLDTCGSSGIASMSARRKRIGCARARRRSRHPTCSGARRDRSPQRGLRGGGR